MIYGPGDGFGAPTREQGSIASKDALNLAAMLIDCANEMDARVATAETK